MFNNLCRWKRRIFSRTKTLISKQKCVQQVAVLRIMIFHSICKQCFSCSLTCCAWCKRKSWTHSFVAPILFHRQTYRSIFTLFVFEWYFVHHSLSYLIYIHRIGAQIRNMFISFSFMKLNEWVSKWNIVYT